MTWTFKFRITPFCFLVRHTLITLHPLTVGTGWQRQYKTRHSLRKLGNEVTGFFPLPLLFLAVIMIVVVLSQMLRCGIPELHTEGMTALVVLIK